MAKTDIHLKFNLGKHVVCIEDGHGYGSDAPGMFDCVNVTVRERKDRGQPGAIVDRQLYVKRSQILAIALGFYDIASKMALETTWQRSETVAAAGQQRPLFPMTKIEHEALCDFDTEDVKELRSKAARSYDNLRSRVHILQRCQALLEHLSDESSNQLDLLLTVFEHAGALPFRMEAGVSPVFELMPSSDTAH